MSIRHRHWMIVAGLLVTLAVGGAGAGELISGEGFVSYKNVEGRVLVIQGRDFAVDDRTVYVDRDGNRMSLSEIPVSRSEEEWRERGDVVWVDWDAVQSNGTLLLRRVRQTEMPH